MGSMVASVLGVAPLPAPSMAVHGKRCARSYSASLPPLAIPILPFTDSSVQWFKGRYQHPNTYIQVGGRLLHRKPTAGGLGGTNQTAFPECPLHLSIVRLS